MIAVLATSGHSGALSAAKPGLRDGMVAAVEDVRLELNAFVRKGWRV